MLKRSSIKLSPAGAKGMAVLGMVVLCVLSSSLLLNLSVMVVGFLVALVVVVLIYVRTYAKNVEIENDLLVDYTSEK